MRLFHGLNIREHKLRSGFADKGYPLIHWDIHVECPTSDHEFQRPIIRICAVAPAPPDCLAADGGECAVVKHGVGSRIYSWFCYLHGGGDKGRDEYEPSRDEGGLVGFGNQ
jgi:hypothetical protein